MATLSDLISEGDEQRVIVACFPLEDQSKTLAEVFPPSWINQEEQTIIPLLLVPKEIVKEVCQYMWNQGGEFLKQYFEEHPEA